MYFTSAKLLLLQSILAALKLVSLQKGQHHLHLCKIWIKTKRQLSCGVCLRPRAINSLLFYLSLKEGFRVTTLVPTSAFDWKNSITVSSTIWQIALQNSMDLLQGLHSQGSSHTTDH